jgi:opacity protein-like surface antigen
MLQAAVLLTTAAGPALAEEPPHQSPPPPNVEYFQYGAALDGESVANAGSICPAGASAPCILGSGGGLAIRAGYRARGPWYFGGVYSFSRHDSANLIRLAILQQFRFETRRYWELGSRTSPYLCVGIGGVLYGNEWGAESGGGSGTAGAGLDFQLSDRVNVGLSLAYRPLVFRAWTDGAGTRRADGELGVGLAHLIGLELILEVREPLPRW